MPPIRKVFELSVVFGIMFGIIGTISADSGYGAVGVLLWIVGMVIILIGYIVGVAESPEYRPAQVYQYPPAPPGMTAFCPHCGAQVAPSAVMCPRCGRSFSTP